MLVDQTVNLINIKLDELAELIGELPIGSEQQKALSLQLFEFFDQIENSVPEDEAA